MQAWLGDSAFLLSCLAAFHLNAWPPRFGLGYVDGSMGLKKSPGQANGKGAVLGNLKQMLQSAE